MKSSKITIFLVFLTLTILISGCSDSINKNNEQLTEETRQISAETGTEADQEATAEPEMTEENDMTFILPTYPDETEKYYVELLNRSLRLTGYKPKIILTEQLPQKRAVQMLDTGEISMMHLIESAERDEKYTKVDVGLTGGLIGNRILLVPKGQEDMFSQVDNLDDFKAMNKTGAFGKNWFDVEVWKANNLNHVIVDGEWRNIYSMLETQDRGINYFSRGLTEIIGDSETHPELGIEKNLVLIYDRDFVFYLSDEYKEYEDIITEALRTAKEQGLMTDLVSEYWKEDIEKTALRSRKKILLETPE